MDALGEDKADESGCHCNEDDAGTMKIWTPCL
jgi:hypothetical protein